MSLKGGADLPRRPPFRLISGLERTDRAAARPGPARPGPTALRNP